MKKQVPFISGNDLGTGNDFGFTLIELMVVIVIIGILVGVVAINFRDAPEQARWEKSRGVIATLESAIELYRLDNSRYPTTEQGLEALIEAPQIEPLPRKYRDGGYLKQRKVPSDPWGNDYIYLSPGTNGPFDITCYGADGVPGGEGFEADINNWEIE